MESLDWLTPAAISAVLNANKALTFGRGFGGGTAEQNHFHGKWQIKGNARRMPCLTPY
jgi:hypothetical protein